MTDFLEAPNTPRPQITTRIHRPVSELPSPAHPITLIPKSFSLPTRPNVPLPPPPPAGPPPSSSKPPRVRDDLPRPVNALPRNARAASSVSKPTVTQTHGRSGSRITSGPGPPSSYGASSATLVEHREPNHVHWASYIFNGNRWRSSYRATSQV
jgi:hypothetical protein